MDEMDLVMHAASDPAPLSSGHVHHSQAQGCPYFRSDHGHPTSLPNTHPPHPLFQPQHLALAQSNAHSHAHAHTAFLLSSGSHGAPSLHPAPHPQQHPQHAGHPPHPHYDPVHAASGGGSSGSSGSGSSWFSSAQNPHYPWSAPVPVPLPPHPPQLPHSRPGPGPSSEPYFAGVGGGSVPASSAGAPGSGPGPIQPGLLQNQHQLPPHHDHFGPYTFYRHHQPASTHHRFPSGPPPPQSHNNSHTGLHSQPPPHQHQPISQQQPPQAQQPSSQLSSLGGDRPAQPREPAATAAPRISLPALNPYPHPTQAPPPTMSNSSSGESSPAAPPASRASLFASPDDSPRAGQSRASGGGSASSSSSSSANQPHPRQLLFFGSAEPSRAEAGPATMTDTDALFAGPTPPVPPNTERRRGFVPRVRLGRGAPPSDYGDSDEDPDMLDSESEAITFLEQFTVANPAFRDRDNDEFRIRAHQILRGQLSNKRVASKKALAQLQSVDISTLEESERTCVICYNEFNVENPEGVREAALRLPNCKHIFGDHCIKKWFEESDSCPYCRDKVHSEPAISAQSRALHNLIQNYSQTSRFTGGRETRPLPNTGEPYVRMIANSAEPRYDSSPPRAWQTGERRSPPSSDSAEPRRRTRPRHGSFRGSPSTSTSNGRPAHHSGANSAAPPQQSPARERVGPPRPPPPAWHQFIMDRSLTRPSEGQFMPMASSSRSYGFTPAMARPPVVPPMQQAEQLGLTQTSMHPTPMGPGFGAMLSPVEDHTRYQMPLNGGSVAPPSDAGHLPGPAQMAAYAQLPPMGALEGPGYSGASSAASGHSTSTEPW